MISVYKTTNTDFSTLGDAVLTPLSGSVKQVAGGNYTLTMVHPIDPDGKWKLLVPGAIVKVPVPAETIDNAYSGLDVDVYVTNGSTGLRETIGDPQVINYPAWIQGEEYDEGDKVTFDGRNYQARIAIRNKAVTALPSTTYSWMEIPRYTAGPNIIVATPAGTELYLIESAGSGWYKMATYYGIEGYIKSGEVTYSHHLSPSETKAHEITEQLFRLYDPIMENGDQTITVTGMHVSYDLSGILIHSVDLSAVSPAYALSKITEGLMEDYPGTIATNLTTEDGTYTGAFKFKNGTFALLDPDSGIVPSFDAKYTRDNWDVFVMRKEEVNRGYFIRYGNNARGITWKRDITNLVTRVVPVAKDEDGSDLLLPEGYIESPKAGDYPTVRMKYLQVRGQVGRNKDLGDDSTWTKAELLDEMRNQAQQRFSVWHEDDIKQEVTVQFEQMGDTDEYSWLKELEHVLLYDTIKVIDDRIASILNLHVTELEFDIIRRKVTGLKLRNVNEYGGMNVTSYNVVNNSIGPAKLTEEAIHVIARQAMQESEDNSVSDYTPVKDTLTSDSTWEALSAAQGKELKRQIDELRRLIPN